MAITYQESADLMKDAVFLGRVKVAGLHYAAYISDEASSVPAHNTRVRWAQSMFQAPDDITYRLTPVVVMDAAVQDAGANVTDAQLQSATENAINKII